MRNYKKDELYPNSKILSSSQFIDYAKSPANFYAKWIAGFEMKRSAALEVGVAFGELYADRSFDYRSYLLNCGIKVPARLIDLVGSVIKYFPKPNKPEYELRVPFEGWLIRITLDDVYFNQNIIVEHKTSGLGWSQAVADNHIQITLQQWAYWKLKKRVPKKTLLNWIDTGYHPVKPVQTFEVKKKVEQLEMFEKTIVVPVLKHLEMKNFSSNIF